MVPPVKLYDAGVPNDGVLRIVARNSRMPESLAGAKYYRPTERGFEKEIKRRLDGWDAIKKKRREQP